MSNVSLGDLLIELSETPRNSTTGALDNGKRTRAINRTLQDLQDYADWIPTKRTVEFEFIQGLNEYSLENFVGASCFDNDGLTTIPDFKSPYDLRFKDIKTTEFKYKEKDEMLYALRRGKNVHEYTAENGMLYINYSGLAAAQLHACDSLTALGTVAVSGNATNLTLDEVNYEEGSGAFNFDVSAGTSLILTINLTTPLDLETLENRAFLTLFADLPTVTNFTSMAVKFGSSATDYWAKTETRPASKADLTTGRSKWAFKWADATQTGTPDASAIDYIQITITYSGATTATDFRIDDIRMSESETMELEYFSLAMVETASGSMQLEFNADDVTQTDLLRGGIQLRRSVVQGSTYELFEIIGGKSERDRTDSYKKYERQLKMEFAKCGYKLRRPTKIANFPGRH